VIYSIFEKAISRKITTRVLSLKSDDLFLSGLEWFKSID